MESRGCCEVYAEKPQKDIDVFVGTYHVCFLFIFFVKVINI